jgi:hypothetical protein
MERTKRTSRGCRTTMRQHLHDCVFESVERSFDDVTLRRLFLALPVSIQELAVQWGLSDTGVRDDIYGWLQVNQTVLRTRTDHDS